MVASKGVRERLQRQLTALNDADLEVVDGFLSAMARPIEVEPGQSSWLTKPWFEAFTARLRAHHALSIDPLSTKQFEDAFNASCKNQEWETLPAESATHRFYDTTVVVPSGVRRNISLKASSARDLRRNSVHISKLTEAAWIQDERTQSGRRAKLVELFREYREVTACIIMLRAFRQVDGEVLYELIEISTDLFTPVEQLTPVQAQAATIPIPPGQLTPDFKIRVDRSDSKITLADIRLSTCTIHGKWRLPPENHDSD